MTVKQYVSESYHELMNHVTWPSYAEAQKLTLIVLVFSVVMAIAIWGVDQIFQYIISEIYTLLNMLF